MPFSGTPEGKSCTTLVGGSKEPERPSSEDSGWLAGRQPPRLRFHLERRSSRQLIQAEIFTKSHRAAKPLWPTRNRNPAKKAGAVSRCNQQCSWTFFYPRIMSVVIFPPPLGSSLSRTFSTHVPCNTAPRMTNVGPLTTTFTATGVDCQSTYFAANDNNQWIQYGQPDTTQCVPASFTPYQKYYYSPGICPSGYHYACEAGIGTSSTQATCCPTLVIPDTGPRKAGSSATETLVNWRKEDADFV